MQIMTCQISITVFCITDELKLSDTMRKKICFVLISNDLLYGSLCFVKRSLYGSLRLLLSVLSDVAFSIKTYKMQLGGIM